MKGSRRFATENILEAFIYVVEMTGESVVTSGLVVNKK